MGEVTLTGGETTFTDLLGGWERETPPGIPRRSAKGSLDDFSS
jgi:hypothetical protein